MAKKNIPERKGFPGGLLLFILIAVLIVMTFQTFFNEKASKVGFSYQLEHLVNLDLLVPEEDKKVAQNDNLVTFAGKFREDATAKGKARFEYLQLLDEHRDLNLKKEGALEDLNGLEASVKDSAVWFFEISGIREKTPFVIVGPIYDFPDRKNAISVATAQVEENNFQTTRQTVASLSSNTASDELLKYRDKVSRLINYFFSSKLGIGDESMKADLRSIKEKVEALNDKSSSAEIYSAYTASMQTLDSIIGALIAEHNGMRLTQLRTVRSYKETIDNYGSYQKQLEKNDILLVKARQKVADDFWYFNDKEISTKALEKQDSDSFNRWFALAKAEWENFPANKGLYFKAPDQPRNLVLEKEFKSEAPSPNYLSYLFTLLPVAVVLILLYYVFSRQVKGVGSSAINFGKSPARLLTKETNKVTFKDVAGADESKEELQEIVEFLKDPQKFTALGARIPKGVLLVGPPGTGKTLIAKAVAGEADRPFFSISGSDFVEMFVGVGASRVRDLFDQAKKNAPCIIFMDEIDAVGRHRGAGIGGGHDEREQTLNQLLVEMDGFDTKEGVILMAATNRPDILDKALLRPGRFDRRVVLDLPDIKGRFEILKVHARKIKMDPSVDLMDIARGTPGASGADLENILNEAALLAARKGRKAVTASETQEASDKVRYGKERRSLEMDANEKKTTAFHESGHAIVGLNVQYADPVEKVTIIPRGFALGATHFMPKKNRLSYWKKEIIDQLAILMGGRAAEEIFIQDMSSGAQQDIAQATNLARAMICQWGMSENLGNVTYDERNDQGQYLGYKNFNERLYSEETAEKIDGEIKALINEAHKRAQEIIKANEEKVKLIANMLMEFETLDKQDIKEIMEGSWDEEKKKKRLQIAQNLQKKTPPPTPTEIKKPPAEPTVQES